MKGMLQTAVVGVALLSGCGGNPPNVAVRMQPLTPDLIEARDRGLRSNASLSDEARAETPMAVRYDADQVWDANHLWADDPKQSELACYAFTECRTTAHGLGV